MVALTSSARASVASRTPLLVGVALSVLLSKASEISAPSRHLNESNANANKSSKGAMISHLMRAALLAHLEVRLPMDEMYPPFSEFRDTPEDESGSQLFFDGKANDRFACDSTQFLTDAADVGVRYLQLRNTLGNGGANEGFFNNLANSWGEDKEGKTEMLLVITGAKLNVLPSKSNSSKPVLAVGFDSEEDTIEIDAETSREMAVIYDCKREGSAIVELRFNVRMNVGETKNEVCLKWKKVCTVAFTSLSITEGEARTGKGFMREVLTNGEVQEKWQTRMASEGTHDSTTKLSIASTGLEVFEQPTVTSNQKLLTVVARGPTYFENNMKVSSDPVKISIIYTCEYDGFADVTLVLRRVSIGNDISQNSGRDLVLTWRKHCGSTAYTHLNIALKSDTFKNSTIVAARGQALSGFLRACGMVRSGQGDAAEDCTKVDNLVLSIPEQDVRTTFDIRVSAEGSQEPPSFPMPDVSYDRQAMQVSVIQAPRLATGIGGTRQRLPPLADQMGREQVYTMSLKYTCFKEGVTVVMLTLHVLAHNPIEIAWKKKCAEPKVMRGRAFTAPQALLLAVFIIGVFILAIVLVCVFCGDKENKYKYEGVNGEPGGHDLELASSRGRKHARSHGKREASAEPIGAQEGEVTFH